MGAILDKIADGVKAIAPVAANLIIPGSGSFLHQIMRQVTGDGPQTPIDEVAARIDGDPKLMLELRRIAIEREIGLAQVQAGNLATVNETMRAEGQSEHWPQYTWRPVNGFAFPLAVILIYFILPICKAPVPSVPEWVWMGWLAILGVATWDRGKQKRIEAGEQPTGLLAGALKAIRGN